MKKIVLTIIFLISCMGLYAQTGVGWGQQRSKVNFLDTINIAKGWMIKGTIITPSATKINYLNIATGTTGTGNIVFSASPALSGTIALGAGSITMTGSLGATGAGKLTKIWTVDGEFTNLPTINGGTLKTGLGVTTVGDAFMTLVNPSAITFPRIDAANTVTARSAANFKADLSLENVTNESKATILNNSVLTGHPTIEGVTATGATGTGNLVFGTAPTISNTTLTGNTQINDSIPFADALYAETREFNIQDYGAIENDANEDQTAINAAITAAAAYSGGGGRAGTVYIPAGDWVITAPIIRKSYVTVRCEPGAYFTVPGAYSNCFMTNNNVAMQDSWWIGGQVYGSTKTWNFYNIRASANANRVIYDHVKDVKIIGADTVFSAVFATDGWSNAGKYENITAHNCVVFCTTVDAVASGNGFDGNKFINIDGQKDADWKYGFYNMCGDLNQIINCHFWDLTGVMVGLDLTANANNNIFIGNFGDDAMIDDVGTDNYILNRGKVISHYPLKAPVEDLTYVSAGNGLTSGYLWEQIYFHDDDPINITANPQFADGFGGQKITIYGSSDSDVLTLDDGTGLQLANSNHRIIGSGQAVNFVYSADKDLWLEIAPTNITQVKSFTIGWDGATGTDFKWTGDAGHVQQNLDLGAILPAKADIIKVDIVCTEELVGCTDINIGAGNASAGAQYVAAASCDGDPATPEVITSTAVLTDAVLMNYASATNVWISGDPSDNNWSDMTAGKWTVYITYVNYTNF